MSITLKLVRESDEMLYFDLPDTVEYAGKTVGEFKMSSPAGLIRALNADGEKLHDILTGKEAFEVDWSTAKIHRRLIRVNKYASKEAYEQAKKYQKAQRQEALKWRQCPVCSSPCQKSKKMLGCCSDACRQVKRIERNATIKKTHWARSDHRADVSKRRAESKKRNDDAMGRLYVPWNKGKTGVYSQETLEKIRSAAQLQFHRELFKKTTIEKKVDDCLRSLGIDYKYSYILSGRQYDFVLYASKVLLEVHGDFWHANPKSWGVTRPLRDHQKMKRLDDEVKCRIARDAGFEYVVLWEYDIRNCWEDCVKKIKEIASGEHEHGEDDVKNQACQPSRSDDDI